MRVLVRIRKCLGWLGLAMTSERMAIVRTYLLLRRIARDEDAMIQVLDARDSWRLDGAETTPSATKR